MPRYKVLRGVVHNIGHSFTSLMNYTGDDYTMGHILKFARETGQDTLTIDFMTGEGKPVELLRDPISQVSRWYTKMFWDMVASSGSDRSLIQLASLTFKYDLSQERPGQSAGNPESPYMCEVSICDIRGKNYRARFEGWWYMERIRFIPRSRQWWNPIMWFRKR